MTSLKDTIEKFSKRANAAGYAGTSTDESKTLPVTRKLKAKASPPIQNTDAVNVSNALMRAKIGYSLNENRFLSLAISRLNSMNQSEYGGLTVEIHAEEYARVFGVEVKTAYSALAEGVRDLQGKVITIQASLPSQRTGKLTKAIICKNWTASAIYISGEGLVNVTFNSELTPHLLNLQQNFTSMNLRELAQIKLLYAYRLYELLSQFRKTGHARFTVEEFFKLMEIPDWYKSNFKDVRYDILMPAIKHLKKTLGWTITLKTPKQGRRIAELEFTYTASRQLNLGE